jgi:vacuolar-type H+-ATPase subunit I/STV1
MQKFYSHHARSELMELYRVIIPKDDAWKVVEALGNTDAAHFVDLNKNEQPFMLPYA